MKNNRMLRPELYLLLTSLYFIPATSIFCRGIFPIPCCLRTNFFLDFKRSQINKYTSSYFYLN